MTWTGWQQKIIDSIWQININLRLGLTFKRVIERTIYSNGTVCQITAYKTDTVTNTLDTNNAADHLEQLIIISGISLNFKVNEKLTYLEQSLYWKLFDSKPTVWSENYQKATGQ